MSIDELLLLLNLKLGSASQISCHIVEVFMKRSLFARILYVTVTIENYKALSEKFRERKEVILFS